MFLKIKYRALYHYLRWKIATAVKSPSTLTHLSNLVHACHMADNRRHPKHNFLWLSIYTHLLAGIENNTKDLLRPLVRSKLCRDKGDSLVFDFDTYTVEIPKPGKITGKVQLIKYLLEYGYATEIYTDQTGAGHIYLSTLKYQVGCFGRENHGDHEQVLEEEGIEFSIQKDGGALIGVWGGSLMKI